MDFYSAEYQTDNTDLPVTKKLPTNGQPNKLFTVAGVCAFLFGFAHLAIYGIMAVELFRVLGDSQFLQNFVMTFSQYNPTAPGFYPCFIIQCISGLLTFFAGAYGLQNAKNPSKMDGCLKFGIIVLAISIAGFALNILFHYVEGIQIVYLGLLAVVVPLFFVIAVAIARK